LGCWDEFVAFDRIEVYFPLKVHLQFKWVLQLKDFLLLAL
jgi:hypothetical protein